MRAGLLLILPLAAALTGCGEAEAPPPMPVAEPASSVPHAEEQDPRMRAIHGADAVGSDGDFIHRAVQGVKDRADERQRQVDAATPS